MKNLTKELQKIIDAEVSKKVVKIKGNVQEYKDFIDGFLETLDHFEKDGREMMEDCKNDKLKFSEAEAEGFLRGVITIKNQLISDYKWIDKKASAENKASTDLSAEETT